jgi:hypothetical protein
MIVEEWGMVKLVFNEALFGVSGTEHFLQQFVWMSPALLL